MPNAGLAALLLLFAATLAWPQEALRMSLAGTDAAEARRRANATLDYFNLKLGPAEMRLGTSLGLEYSDNVLLTAYHQLDDFILHPAISAQTLLQTTEKNALNLDLAMGYSAYVFHPELNRIFIGPGSELSFDVYAGDLWLNLHDRFSITENSYQDPTVTSTGNYSRLENALGLACTWELNKLVLRSGYDHVNYVALSGSNGQPDGESELLSSSAGFKLKSNMVGGVELGAGLVRYTGTNPFFSDAKQWNAGLFFKTQVSQYIHCRASLGYTEYLPEIGTASDDIYVQLDIEHNVNQFIFYTLTGGRTISFAFYGGSVDLTYARLIANWNIVRKLAISTSLNYEHGAQVGAIGEIFDRYGVGITLSRTITSRLTAVLADQFYWRNSNFAHREYENNILSLNFSYRF